MGRMTASMLSGVLPEDGWPDTEVEKGSAFTRADALFNQWNDGRVLAVDEWEARDLGVMMKRFGRARAIESVLTLPLNGLDFSITPRKGDSGEADWLNEFVETPANQGGMSTPLDEIIEQATSAVVYKKAFFEKIFKVNDNGDMVYDSIGWRPQSTCTAVRDPATAKFGGFVQEPVTVKQQQAAKMMPIKIEPKYAWVYIHDSKRDPINGRSDLEITYWCYKTVQKILFLYFNFLEGQALPRTIVEAADIGRATQIAGQVASLKNSGVLPISNTSGANQKVYTLDTSGGGNSTNRFLEAIKYLEHTASLSVMAGFIDLTDVGTGGRGSLALSKDQSDFFLQSIMAKAKELARYVRNYLLADLIYYNFGLKANVPNFEFGSLSEADQTSAVSMLQSLAVAPNLNVPGEFVEQLAMSVSNGLNLDSDKVHDAFQNADFKEQQKAKAAGAGKTAQGAAGLGGAVDEAGRLVEQETGVPVPA